MPPDSPASKPVISLSIEPRTLGMVMLLALDLLIIGPGGWLLKMWLDHYHEDLAETHVQMDRLQQQIERLDEREELNRNAISSLSANNEQFRERMKDFQERLNDIKSCNGAQ